MSCIVEIDAFQRNKNITAAALDCLTFEAHLQVPNFPRRTIDDEMLDAADRLTIRGQHIPAPDIRVGA